MATESTETLFDQARLAQALARLEAEKSKQELEFARYKQDCRKKSLDLAMSRVPYVKEEKSWSPTNDQIQKLADELYQWLITIPEK
jgi:tRNA1(Val) A37 N6-methylase TrmN6